MNGNEYRVRATTALGISALSDSAQISVFERPRITSLNNTAIHGTGTFLVTAARGSDASPFVFALENRMARNKKSMVMKTLAKLPDCGIKGLGAHLLERLHKQAFESGYDEVIHALMHESNVSATILADGAELLHTYVLYEWRP